MSRTSSIIRPTPIPTPKVRKEQKPLFAEKHSKLFNGFRLPKHLEQKISLIELHQKQEAFILYHEQDKSLSRENLGPLLRSLGLVISNIGINRYIVQFDVEEKLDLVQLLEAYARLKELKGDPEELGEAIRGLAGDRPDLELKQLKADMTVLGDPISEREFDEVIRLIGTRNGRVNCDQMKHVLMSRFK